jgi:uncharacterized protein with PIN domain
MYKQAPKSPAMKALVGNQKNLPQALKAQIEAAPSKMMSPAKQTEKIRVNPSSDSIKSKHKKGVAQDTRNARALNDNLNAALADYRADRNPQTKAALQEAKDMKKGGSTFSTKGRVTSRKLGEDYPA